MYLQEMIKDCVSKCVPSCFSISAIEDRKVYCPKLGKLATFTYFCDYRPFPHAFGQMRS